MLRWRASRARAPLLTDQLITTSQNKWKEGWIKLAENWKQIWINSALKWFIYQTKWLKIKCQSRKWISETYKDSAVNPCKRIRVSFAQDSLKCQNWNLRMVGIWTRERSSCSVTKLYNYSETKYPFKSKHWSKMCII